MKLRDIDMKTFDPDIVLLHTPSSKMEIFVQDKIKRHLDANVDSTIIVENKADLKQVRDCIGVTPYHSDKWYVRVNLDKFNNKDLHKVIQDSSTCVFLCTCSKYKIFKEFKETFEKKLKIADFYFVWLKRDDFIYLYDAFVPEDKRLAPALLSTVMSGYSSDIEALFELFLALNGGEVFKSESDIVAKIGLGSLSTDAYVFKLLKPLSGSEKGLKKVMKDRTKYGLEMGGSLGWTTYYNFLNKCILAFIDIKMLLISGSIYKSLKDLPEGYDKGKLARYNRHIWRIKEVPMSDLLLLRKSMGTTVWKTELDFITFIYTYYTEKAKLVIGKGQGDVSNSKG